MPKGNYVNRIYIELDEVNRTVLMLPPSVTFSDLKGKYDQLTEITAAAPKEMVN